MSSDRSKPDEVSGLSKIEAEDLLDRLEAAGCEPCHLSFVDGEGFRVRPKLAPTDDAADLAENESEQERRQPINGSLSGCS